MCVEAYKMTFNKDDRDDIRKIVLSWIDRIAYKEDISVFVDLPYPSIDFNGREVSLGVVFERMRKKALMKKKLDEYDWYGAFEDYWEELVKPFSVDIRNVLGLSDTKVVKLGVSRFHDTSLIKAFWDTPVFRETMNKEIQFDLNTQFVDWEQFDTEFKNGNILALSK